jgi:RimJ/RimL family protein N-acetyltransferase
MKVIQALQKSSLSGLEVIAVVGASNPHIDKLEAVVNKSRIPIRIVPNAQNMPELMTWADVAVSSGGTTIWELAFMGVPTILIIQMENQRIAAEALHRAGAALNLGWADRISIKDLSVELERFLSDSGKRQEMSSRLQTLVDGEGTSRLIMHIKGEKLRLRRVREEDCKLLWEWTNDPVVRDASFNADAIPWETHVAWFQQKIADSNCSIFIFFNDKDIPVGQVRFDTSEHEAESNVSISDSFRSRGYGVLIIQMASQRLFRETGVTRIYAHIKPENEASIQAFEKAGYKPAGIVSFKGHRALRMILEKHEEVPYDEPN